MASTETEGQCQSLGTHSDTSKYYSTFRAKNRRDGDEASEGSLLQGMGSLHPHHLQPPSAFAGGVCSVVLKRSGESQTELFLRCWELQCDCLTAAQRLISPASLDMKLTFTVDFHPVLSLYLTCVFWLPAWFLLRKSVKISSGFLDIFFRAKSWTPVPVHLIL